MTELDHAVERFALLNAEITEPGLMDRFYAQCFNLPIAYLEEALKRHKEESKTLECKTIPELMFSENRKSVETMDGVSINIRSEINASMKGADIEQVHAWLEQRGYGAIVKQKHFLADERDVEIVEGSGIKLYADKEVNTNSLKKVLKEIYEKTEELPSELMNVSIFNHAVIKFAKEEKDE